MRDWILSNEDIRKIKLLKMREKFKKVEKGNGNLDLKDFGYEVIDERFVPNQEAYLGD